MSDKLRAAAEAALEALEYGQHTLKQVSETQWESRGELAMQMLRAALAEPEVERAEIGPEWTPCVKRPVTVHVRGQRPGEAHVSTREGLTPVKPDDLIMRGVDGEEYPIGRDLFNRTYSFKAALAEPQQEPVAWADEVIDELQSLYDTDGIEEQGTGDALIRLSDAVAAVEAAAKSRPPRREWVGLTEQEIWDSVKHGVVGGIGMPSKAVAVARAIEAALKEKNK